MSSAEDELAVQLREQTIAAAARVILAVIVGLCVMVYFFWPSKKVMAQQLITRERRSVVKYKGKAPAAAVDRALQAAIHAPNHFLSEPWRFRVLGPETVKKIVALNEEKRSLFEGIPGWMMVSLVPKAGDEKWHKLALEDHAACACAVQNFMLSLAAEGYGSKWMTGAMGIPPGKLLECAGTSEAEEHFMGVIFFGQPEVPTATMKVPSRKIGLGAPVYERLP
eukprot:CAMPEP_0115827498 /NCGR_PEP_ID=MMETSP0287-20121206/76_1 /TAXON_ID=412157 /ORGANISM="Chrysochromulina rotalis, Strain UIO044" /LENGTH=222 /DNA_ID=CAMNT_0003280659 /DNA_START=21 /DNA_END=689 /DNA_ORIENTATION=-